MIQAQYNQRRLRELAAAQQGKVHVFCAHDPSELHTLQRAQSTQTTA